MDINKILEKHEKWLKGIRGGIRADLSGADLRGVDLSGVDLSGADLHGANLEGVNFTRANLCETNLYIANLSKAVLREANLYRADLSWVNLYKADLREADLISADLCAANLCEANLSGANLNYAKLTHTDLSKANLKSTDLTLASLSGTNLSGVKNLLSAIDYIKANFETTNEGIIAYKTFATVHEPPEDWIVQPGRIIAENCNMSRTDLCGCGINVATLEWVRKNCKGDIWQILIRWEWLCGVCVPYNTDGKIRCEKAELIGIVESN